MYYYAKINAENVCMEVVEETEPVDENGWIEINSLDYDLIGMWYDIETQSFTHVGNKYLRQLKYVDGAGSGLDSDKLDGKSSEEFALANHNHDERYSLAAHDHDGEYAAPEHNHDDTYAYISHGHLEYAATTHDHEGDYADYVHNHDGAYSPINHEHDEDYASATHNHDSVYSSVNHEHDLAYANITHTHTAESIGAAEENHTHSEKANDNAVVHKTGEETVTGTKTFTANPFVNKSNANLILKVSDLTKGSLPTNASYDGLAVQDKDGNVLANLRYAQNADGSAYIQLKACDYRGDAADYADVRIYKTVDGQKYVQVPNLVKLANGLQAIYSSTNMQFGSASMDTLINGKDDVFIQTRMDTRSIVPNANNTYQIGNSTNRFKTIYLNSAANVSSDERLKQDIETVHAGEQLRFIKDLEVVEYAFKDTPHEKRIGLIAQQVEAVGGEKYVVVDMDGLYGLKTADLVYPLIAAVQALSQQLDALTTDNMLLMERVEKLEKGGNVE